MAIWLKKRLMGLSGAVGFVTLLFLLLSLAGRWHFIFDMLTHGRLQYCLALLVSGICLLVWSAKRRFGLLFLMVGLLLLFSMSKFYLPKPQGDKDQPIRIVSLNVLTSNSSKDKVIGYIESEQADIIIVSEVDEIWREALDKAFSKSHPHSKLWTSWDNFGIGVYSRLPFEPGSSIKQFGSFKIAYLDLYFKQQQQQQQFRLIGMHPVPPSNASYWRERNRQLAGTARLVTTRPDLPTIVCGDLNCSPWSPFYRDMLKLGNLTNAAEGFGLWPTWTAFSIFLGLPIDHVLVNSKVQVLDHRVGKNVGSDHRGITVDLVLKQN